MLKTFFTSLSLPPSFHRIYFESEAFHGDARKVAFGYYVKLKILAECFESALGVRVTIWQQEDTSDIWLMKFMYDKNEDHFKVAIVQVNLKTNKYKREL